MNRLLLLAAIAITMLSCNDIDITIIKSENHKEVDISQFVDLSESGTANCYLVKSAGKYKFKAVKGNSDEVLSLATTADVLWESFGTEQMPKVGDIISSVTYKDDYVCFTTSDTFRDGNASIAVRDSEGTILWSWHIWCSDEGWKDQVYARDAGTVMDRNLGATSANPGYVGALGLLYQWGRKDPFLGPNSISGNEPAASTATWPKSESSNNIDFANQNPMTFARGWLGGNVSDNGWHTSESEKGLYDPCPAGYRVPDGGSQGLWQHSSIGFDKDYVNKGIYWKTSVESIARAWYPAVGYLSYLNGTLTSVGTICYYYSANPNDSYNAFYFDFSRDNFNLMSYNNRSNGLSVRCIREESTTDDEQQGDLSQYTDLSKDGTANCYPVEAVGKYKFKAVKGNSKEALSLASTADVLWETFGTNEMPNVGDVIHSVGYKDGYVYFSTPDLFRDGNASIAVRDSKGNILWSWHIWCSKEGWIDQVYPNGAGTMMDRNLGATSATPGSVGALGLLYQWGRKDPFTGSYTISSSDQAQATGLWNSVSCAGSIDYAISNPTTYLYLTYDWCGDSTSETIDGIYRWKNGQKTIYDPCPVGYRVPDGGEDDFWNIAFPGSTISDVAQWYSTYRGVTIPLSGSTNSAWYPSAGYRDYNYGKVVQCGSMGVFWTASAYKESNDSLSYSIIFADTIYGSVRFRFRCDGCSVRCIREGTTIDDEQQGDLSQYTDLSKDGTANCYPVEAVGNYKFKAVKGNSEEALSLATTADVLWESFGTEEMPNVGDVIHSVGYKDGYVYFSTPDLFRAGNASIAVRDSEGTILWSWHIWCSKEVWIDQVYLNGAGVVMDRNLGATSATPGYVEAFGLLYQWGRKDPFLGPSSISGYQPASSTGTWPTAYNSNDIDYVNKNPMTFAGGWRGGNVSGNGWHTSESEKGLYDPCPVGYRVPDGGEYGLWDRAYIGSELDAEDSGVYWYITNEARAWYPIFGYLSYDRGGINASSSFGYNWSASADPSSTDKAYCFHYQNGIFPLNANYDRIFPIESSHRGQGNAVRCIREGSTTAIVPPDDDEGGDEGGDEGDDEQLVDLSQYTDLSKDGTANCYPIKAVGNYKFKAVKGNYGDPLNLASTADVLWETFGTEEMPNVGDIIHSVGYQYGYVYFSTSDVFRDGNASIAVRDSAGTILWSWHIWCSKEGWKYQVYPNGADIIMDRNLGATSATPGSVGALGLLYQWGRKDPFIGSYTISSSNQAQATGLWNSVSSAQSIDYAISNPTTYIYYTHDWCSDSTSETTDGIYRWKNGQKTIYDPCPVGYRVPDGGEDDFWNIAFPGSTISDVAQWDSTYRGVTISPGEGINLGWYPSAGYRDYNYGKVVQCGSLGVFWTASAYKESTDSYSKTLSQYSDIVSDFVRYRCDGCSVRCVKE